MDQLVAEVQVANRPFRFLRIVRTIRYVRGLRMLATTVVSAIPATLKVSRLTAGIVQFASLAALALRWGSC